MVILSKYLPLEGYQDMEQFQDVISHILYRTNFHTASVVTCNTLYTQHSLFCKYHCLNICMHSDILFVEQSYLSIGLNIL